MTESKDLDALIAWLEKQPFGSRYEYIDPAYCLFAQFLGRSVTINEAMRAIGLSESETDAIALVGNDTERMGYALERAYKVREARNAANGQFGVGA